MLPWNTCLVFLDLMPFLDFGSTAMWSGYKMFHVAHVGILAPQLGTLLRKIIESREQRLAGECMSLGWALFFYSLAPAPLATFLCLLNVGECDPPASSSHYLPCPNGLYSGTTVSQIKPMAFWSGWISTGKKLREEKSRCGALKLGTGEVRAELG